MDITPQWYLVDSEEKHVRQIVIRMDPRTEIAPQVDNLLPSVELFEFMQTSWAAITVPLSDDRSRPLIFIKAEGVIDQLRNCLVRVAFSFYKMQTGGLFCIFVHVNSPTVEAKTGNPCVFENPHNLNSSEERDLCTALMTTPHLDVCFTAAGENGPCTGYFGLRVSIPQDCREALQREWESLLRYHKSIPSTRRSFQGAIVQFEQENPLEDNPVLPDRVPPVLGRER